RLRSRGDAPESGKQRKRRLKPDLPGEIGPSVKHTAELGRNRWQRCSRTPTAEDIVEAAIQGEVGKPEGSSRGGSLPLLGGDGGINLCQLGREVQRFVDEEVGEGREPGRLAEPGQNRGILSQ